MNRSELIAAIEAATGPSRELDVRIFALSNDPAIIREPGDHRGRGIVTWTLSRWIKEEGCDAPPDWWGYLAGCVQAPSYTSSLDAALTLVPEDLDWALGSSREVPTYNAFLFQRDDNSTHAGEAYHAKTPAIALCIAAIKAKEGKDG